MLDHAPNLQRDLVLGVVAPSRGILTVEKAAINAVMAGCPPAIFPYVLAVCEALVDPEFEIGPVQNTTHCVTPLIVVNGPLRGDYGFHWDDGALGPGFRANASLGRVLRLIMINVGGGVPGVGDMAQFGAPAKFTCCLAEAEEENPFGPFHASRGFVADENTVTLLSVEGPHQVVFSVGDMNSEGDMLLQLLATCFASPGSNSIYLGRGQLALILNPTHARMLAQCGFTRISIQQRLFELATYPREEIRKISGATLNAARDQGNILRVVKRPEDFLIFVAGASGAGAYSMLFPTWGGGSNGQLAVTKRVRFDDMCEIPVSLRA